MILNEEQRLLADTIADFLAANAPVEQARQLRDTRDELGYREATWQQLVEMGIPGTALPESDGGLGFGWLGMGAVMQATGRHLSATPLLSSVVLAASALELGGSDAQKNDLLEAIVEGKLVCALAVDEGNHYAPLHCESTLESDGKGSDYTLSGKKVFVVDGHVAGKLLVVARSAGAADDQHGLSLAIVDPAQPGVEIRRSIMMDGRNAAIARFDKVSIAAEQIIGEPGKAWSILSPVLDRATACVAAEMLGGCDELFRRTIDFLKEREQFDVKIGSFQALQHRAASMYCELERCRSAVLSALASLDNAAPDASAQVSVAKALANECYKLVSNEAVQMHGGMGVTDELDIGLFLKRARVCMQLFGDTSYHRSRYAELLGF